MLRLCTKREVEEFRREMRRIRWERFKLEMAAVGKAALGLLILFWLAGMLPGQ